MKAVVTPGTHFDAVELDGIVGVEMEIEALKKERGVHAIGGCDGAAGGGVGPVLEAEDACGAADVLDGGTCAVDGIRVGGIEEIQGEGARIVCCDNAHLFRDWGVGDAVDVDDAGQGVQGALKFRTEFCGSVLAGSQSYRILCWAFREAEDVPAGVHIVEICRDTAVDEFHGDHFFQRTGKCPAKRICLVVGHKIAVPTIDGNSYGALLSVFSR